MSNTSLEPVVPAKPVAPYIGGKKNLATRLVARIETIPHDLYAEPFVGMGGVFLRRKSAPRAEVINDVNREVSNFFRILQRHYVAFLQMMQYQLTTRAEFERLSHVDPNTLTDLERAARFLYLQRTAFGGLVRKQSFGVSPDRPGRFNVTRLAPMLEDLHTRLAGVVIECLSWEVFLARYDRPNALFYLDPPYWGSEKDYGDAFGREDFVRLAEVLRGLKGRFLMSLNDHPGVRETFHDFHFEEVRVARTVGRSASSRKSVGEVIISKRE